MRQESSTNHKYIISSSLSVSPLASENIIFSKQKNSRVKFSSHEVTRGRSSYGWNGNRIVSFEVIFNLSKSYVSRSLQSAVFSLQRLGHLRQDQYPFTSANVAPCFCNFAPKLVCAWNEHISR